MSYSRAYVNNLVINSFKKLPGNIQYIRFIRFGRKLLVTLLLKYNRKMDLIVQ